jgi:hypothetical protein
MLCIAKKTFRLIVAMLGVVMLSVVASSLFHIEEERQIVQREALFPNMHLIV